MKTTLTSVIAILVTLLVTVAYGKTTLVSKSEFKLILDRLDRIDGRVERILEHQYQNKGCDNELNTDDSSTIVSYN